MADKNISLDSMMDKTPRTAQAPIDLTKGYIPPTDPHADTEAEMQPTPTRKRAKAVPVQAQFNPDDVVQVNPTDILPPREPAPTDVDMYFQELDMAVAREQKKIDQRMDEILDARDAEIEEQQEAAEDAKLDQIMSNAPKANNTDEYDTDDLYDDDDDEDYAPIAHKTTKDTNPVVAYNPTEEVSVLEETKEEIPVEVISREEAENERVRILDIIDEDDEEDEDEGLVNNEIDTDEAIKDLKEQIKSKSNRKIFDLSKFSISKKIISTSKAMKIATKYDRNVADWVLYNAKRPISLIGLSGPEILKLNPENTGRNRLNTFKDMYRIVYDHIEDANKPEFEAWLKTTRFVDLQHIYFGLYKATFNGSNFVNYACDNCKKVFIKDIGFDKMVEYDSEDTEKEVAALLKLDTTTPGDGAEYEADLVQVSDKFVFGLRTPSIWSIIIDTASLSDNFIETYSDMIDVISYIDEVYVIDEENSELVPVNTKPDPNDTAKTAARRIRAYYDIIKSLSSEDFYQLRSMIAKVDTDANKIKYFVPGCTCPHCNTKIEDNKDITPEQMLFTRHQLAAIASM